MTWPIPSPSDISDRYSAALEAALSTDPDGNPQDVDARSSDTLLGVMARTHGEVGYEEYLFQANVAKEQFPDTAVQELARHGRLWGVPRVPAKFASGQVIFTATNACTVDAGARLYLGSTYWDLTADLAVAAGGTATGIVVAELSGAAGNLAAGSSLQLQSPVAGLTVQAASVAAGGITGGADIQSLDDWRAAIVDRIRNPAAGGNANDFETWARAAGAKYAKCVPNWQGPGTVGVIIAMAGPRPPTSDELAAVQAYIDGVRPVTGTTYVIGATLSTTPMQITLNPDTAGARIAVQAAVDLFYLSDAYAGQIGGTIFKSRLSDAISAVSGEISHRIYLPAADVTVGNTVLPITSAITWTAPS
ncbi:baseplate J/gp47 family protein [Acidisoma sp. 7E03]